MRRVARRTYSPRRASRRSADGLGTLASLLLFGLMIYLAPVFLAVLVPFALIAAVGALLQGR